MAWLSALLWIGANITYTLSMYLTLLSAYERCYGLTEVQTRKYLMIVMAAAFIIETPYAFISAVEQDIIYMSLPNWIKQGIKLLFGSLMVQFIPNGILTFHWVKIYRGNAREDKRTKGWLAMTMVIIICSFISAFYYFVSNFLSGFSTWSFVSATISWLVYQAVPAIVYTTISE